MLPPFVQANHVDWYSVNGNRAVRRRKKTQHKVAHRRLSGAGRPDESDDFAAPKREGDIRKHRRTFGIGESHVLKGKLLRQEKRLLAFILFPMFDDFGLIFENFLEEWECFVYGKYLRL